MGAIFYGHRKWGIWEESKRQKKMQEADFMFDIRKKLETVLPHNWVQFLSLQNELEDCWLELSIVILAAERWLYWIILHLLSLGSLFSHLHLFKVKEANPKSPLEICFLQCVWAVIRTLLGVMYFKQLICISKHNWRESDFVWCMRLWWSQVGVILQKSMGN